MAFGQVRIIAGKWRGRLLQVPEVKDLRPTPNRVRETLFNWLSPVIVNARCLDLFAGSGALGFEALSRGAGYVELVDQSNLVVDLLQKQLNTFGAENARVYQASVPEGLKKPEKQFNIIFLDPPFKKNLLRPTCYYLEENNFLAKDAYIYLEAEDIIKDNELPPTWRIIKTKQAGQVAYHLVQRIAEATQ